MLRFLTFFSLLFIVRIHGAAEKDDVYDGPVVCQGTKPLLFHENYDATFSATNNAEELLKRKIFFEAYWDQIVNHVTPCQIIVGNLIIPHQHLIPHEADRLINALKQLEIVTGFIYIFDVNINIRFEKLKAVYGNELFRYPKEWSGYDAENSAYNQSYAIFVEKFTGDILYMPQLLYIKHGLIGFKDTPKACVWNPAKGYLSFEQWFDVRSDISLSKLVRVLDRSFTECENYQHQCGAKCERCFANEPGHCQSSTKKLCTRCLRENSPFCDARNISDVICCPKKCHGGCYGQDECVSCKPGYYLQIGSNTAVKKCVPSCHGRILNGTDICVQNSDQNKGQTCPDYMFSFQGKQICSYSCPMGEEFDPITNFAEQLNDKERMDPKFTKYYTGNVCKPCRMVYDSDAKDFKDDCGIGCVIQSNSISFFTVLNIYPAITEIKDFDLSTFQNHFKANNFDDPIFAQKCRHIYGFLHLDQYSVGFPYQGARLVPEHLRVLTYVTGLYGSIRIENTDGYWFADSFRNLLVIQKPIKGQIDQELLQNSAQVRFNSDLRSIDLQRLRCSAANIVVQYNPLYLPPIPILNNATKVFAHVGYLENGIENITFNSLVRTRVNNSIAYDTGCKDGAVSYFYKRCVRCGSNEIRYFTDTIAGQKYHELFAECEQKLNCDTENGYYVVERDGEKQCLKCNKECLKCSDQTPFSCYKGSSKDTLSCNFKKIIGINIHACAADGTCASGFRLEGGNCVRCDGACFTCYDNKKDANGYSFYSVPKGPATNPPKRGCRGCGVVFLAKQAGGGYAAVCGGSSGAPPRCPHGVNCNYFINNPVRDLFNNLQPKNQSESEIAFADYGEREEKEKVVV